MKLIIFLIAVFLLTNYAHAGCYSEQSFEGKLFFIVFKIKIAKIKYFPSFLAQLF